MFNKKGKDILVWINCIVFILIIGLTTLKGSKKEGIINIDNKGDSKDKSKKEIVDRSAYQENCSPEQKKDLDVFYDLNKVYKSGEFYNDWKTKYDKKNDVKIHGKVVNTADKNFKKLKKVDKTLDGKKNEYFPMIATLDIDKGFAPINVDYIDTSEENITRLYCADFENDDDDKKKLELIKSLNKNKKYDEEKKKCEWMQKGKWDMDTKSCICSDVEHLHGYDRYRQDEFIKDKKGNKIRNEKWRQSDNLECRCFVGKWDLTYNKDTGIYSGKCKTANKKRK